MSDTPSDPASPGAFEAVKGGDSTDSTLGLLPFKLIGAAAALDSEMIKQYLPPGFLKEIYKIAEERARNGKDWKSKEDGEEKGIIVDKDGEQIKVVWMCASGTTC
jgi:hypothetical protein